MYMYDLLDLLEKINKIVNHALPLKSTNLKTVLVKLTSDYHNLLRVNYVKKFIRKLR